MRWRFFVTPSLSLVKSGANATLSWPAYPAGFEIASPSLNPPSWSMDVVPSAVLVNGTHTIQIPMTNAVQFFRLSEP